MTSVHFFQGFCPDEVFIFKVNFIFSQKSMHLIVISTYFTQLVHTSSYLFYSAVHTIPSVPFLFPILILSIVLSLLLFLTRLTSCFPMLLISRFSMPLDPSSDFDQSHLISENGQLIDFFTPISGSHSHPFKKLSFYRWRYWGSENSQGM